jgi:uncharacterized protein (DUF924 family)
MTASRLEEGLIWAYARPIMATIDEVLTFWFGEAPATNPAELGARIKRWYMGGKVEDAAIRERFPATVERALAGELDAWAKTPRGRLALILLLDQMTRSLFRGTPRAFAGDPRAQQLASEMLATGTFGDLTFEQRHFVFMPLLHAEDAALLDRYNELFPKTLDSVPEWGRALLGDGIEQGLKYRDLITRFGRFPHRNQALGRRSAPQELEFLETWAQQAAPKESAALKR